MKDDDQAELFELCPISRARLRRMQDNALKNGKAVPTLDHLANIANSECPICRIAYDTNGPRSAPSLQHWEDGSFSIMCCRCNTSHGNMKRPELFGQIPKGMKHCARCDQTKPETDFDKTSRYGKPAGYCAPCNKDATNEWRANNLDRARKQKRDWARNNREKVNTYAAEWRAKNPQEARTRAREYQRSHRAKKRLSAQRDQAATNQAGATLTGSAPKDRDPKT